MVGQSQVTPYDVFQKTNWRVHLQKLHHIVEDCAHCKESFRSGTNVVEPCVIEQYSLNDEGRHRLAQFAAGFHDAEAKRDDFRLKQKGDDLGIIHLDQGTNDSQAGEPKIFERPRL